MVNLIILITIAIILTILIIAGLIILIRKTAIHKNFKENATDTLFQKHNFHLKKILYSTKDSIVAVNRSLNVIAVINNLSQKNESDINYKEIPTSLIYKIENFKSVLKINYMKKNGNDFILINFPTKEVKELVYKIYKNTVLSKIQNKFPTQTLTSTTGSDWECNFVWAYNPTNSTLFYYNKTNEKSYINYFNLLKKFVTLDTRYNYFEAPLLGQTQQLFMHEQPFLNEVVSSLIEIVKQKYQAI